MRSERPMSVRRWGVRMAVVTCVLLLVAVAACSDSQDPAERGEAPSEAPSGEAAAPAAAVVFPGDEWERADPAAMDLDPDVLDEIAADAEAAGSNCLVVTRRGRIVDERYWNDTGPGTAQEVFSATKSVTSTLVGIAEDRELLSVGDPVSEYIPEWADGPSADVTIEHLIRNDSGREWSLELDYRDLIRAADKDRFAVELGQDHQPGEVWAYNNAAIQTLDRVIRAASGEHTADFAAESLLEPIGMRDSRMSRDRAGHALMFMGLHSTCEDMARFGYLFLREGRWEDQQVVSAEWVDRATRPSQDHTSAYGYLWWLNHRGPMVDPAIATDGPGGSGESGEGQMVEGAPESMFFARGLGGQMVAVDPGSETVAVRLAPGRPTEGTPDFGAEDLARVVTAALLDT